MSGHKKTTISITEEEYQRLYQNEMKRMFSPESSSIALQDNLHALKDSFNEFDQRQAIYEQVLLKMKDSIREIEEDTNQLFIAKQAEIFQTLHDEMEVNQVDISKALTEGMMDMQESILDISGKVEEWINENDKEKNLQQQNQAVKYQEAERWIKSILSIYQYIKTINPAWHFFQDELENQVKQAQQSKNNLRKGLLEASIAVSQQTFIQISALRLRIEAYQNKINTLYMSAKNQIETLLQKAVDNQVVHPIDMNNHEINDEQIDVNYWTKDKMAQLLTEIKLILADLENRKGLLGSEYFENVINEKIPDIQKDLSMIISEARISVLNAQIRVNIADIIIQALETQGFTLENAQYENNDDRNAIEIKVDNIEGSTVVVKVSPVPETIGKNDLDLQSYEENPKTQHEMRLRLNEISTALKQYGLALGHVDVLRDQPYPIGVAQSKVPDNHRIQSGLTDYEYQKTRR